MLRADVVNTQARVADIEPATREAPGRARETNDRDGADAERRGVQLGARLARVVRNDRIASRAERPAGRGRQRTKRNRGQAR
jgi:hypothetical protein